MTDPVTREECKAMLGRADKVLTNLHGEATPDGSAVCDENGIVVFYCPKGHINDAKFAIAARTDLPRLARAYMAAMAMLSELLSLVEANAPEGRYTEAPEITRASMAMSNYYRDESGKEKG